MNVLMSISLIILGCCTLMHTIHMTVDEWKGEVEREIIQIKKNEKVGKSEKRMAGTMKQRDGEG